jgi:hypothetical protein
MKVKFKNLVGGYTGKVDGLSIYLHKETGTYLVRRIPKFKPNPQNHDISNVSHNLFNIHPSKAYRNDLRAYIAAYKASRIKNKRTFISWSNAYYVLLYEMQRQNPSQIDLKTITRAEIYDRDLPCKSVASAVAAGLLPEVKDWETLTALL